ncbi:putative bifunctional diguanylate cyclase/phosphodiesterase [Alkalibacillus aidingensis]|uniref:putative bifunctional diguanylate cyclase/phosphodiesterase n=1 Tax=Alkalibacillus aidingensis TaxID=2747607 RepID=UPI0016602BC6|nr:EAL domain-containing protein [Alkalibacillus aidingensis]
MKGLENVMHRFFKILILILLLLLPLSLDILIFGERTQLFWGLYALPVAFTIMLYPSWKYAIGIGVIFSTLKYALEIAQAGSHSAIPNLANLVVSSIIGWGLLIIFTYYLINFQRSQDRLRRKKDEYESIFLYNQDSIHILDQEGKIVDANPAFEHVFGWNQHELVDMSKLIPEHLQEESAQMAQEVLQGKTFTDYESKRIRKDGVTIDVSISFSPIFSEEGMIKRIFVLTRDISERKRMERSLNHLANHDQLTGLPNRRHFNRKLQEEMEVADYHGSSLGVIVLDLDNFKEINDTYGHGVGDEVLIQVANKISTCLTDDGFAARLSGDEFAVIFPESNIELITKHAEMISNKLENEPCNIMVDSIRIDVEVTWSMGASIYPDHTKDMSELLRYADGSLYKAKTQEKNAFIVYDPNDIYNPRNLVKSLEYAINHDELTLNYQPQIDSSSHQLVGLEALVRWIHPRHGFIMPDQFITVAEETGLIHHLGEWVLREACHQWKQWEIEGYKPVPIAINISLEQLKSSDFIDQTRKVIEETEMDPHYLIFEITESIELKDATEAVQQLDAIQAMGIQLALDDFGKGYSSLLEFKLVTFNKVKIDRGFISDITNNHKSQMIVKTIIELAKNLDIDIIAEGIEEIEQCKILESFNCHMMQGYYFDKPLSPTDIEDRLEKRIYQ